MKIAIIIKALNNRNIIINNPVTLNIMLEYLQIWLYTAFKPNLIFLARGFIIHLA